MSPPDPAPSSIIISLGPKTAALGDSLSYAAKTKITSEIEQMKQEIIERLRRGPDGC